MPRSKSPARSGFSYAVSGLADRIVRRLRRYNPARFPTAASRAAVKAARDFIESDGPRLGDLIRVGNALARFDLSGYY